MANASSSYSSISCSSYPRLHPRSSSYINNLQLAFRSSLLYPNLVQLNTNRNGSFSNLSFCTPLLPKNKSSSSSHRVLCMRRPLKAAVVTGGSWNTSVLDSKVPVVVEFYASWCGPCQMVHRVIDEIAAEYAGKIKCFMLNADKDPLITEEYDIKAVPVVLLFKNGEKCESVVGTMPKEFYIAAIERALSSSS